MLQLLLVLAGICSTCLSITDVDGLQGSADFKSVTLHWQYRRSLVPPTAFRIDYCEDQAWGNYRCKKKLIYTPNDIEIPTSSKLQREYAVALTGLRMSTNYSIEVTPIGRSDEDRGRSINHIIIQTKGFSASATRCLANSSVVEINTGPYFGGKISVEDSINKSCSTQGDPSSEKTSYLLNIDHNLCGSKIFNSSVRTFIVVQENLPILTHSTRRFMVVCNYIPETFTVRAGVNLPDYEDGSNDLENVGSSINEVDPSELFDSLSTIFDTSNNLGDVGRALKLTAKVNEKEPEMWAHLVLMGVLVMASAIGLSCAVWHFIRHSKTQNRRGFLSPHQDQILETEIYDTREFEGDSISEISPSSSSSPPIIVENPVALNFLTDNLDNEGYENLVQVFPNLLNPSYIDIINNRPHDEIETLTTIDDFSTPINEPISFITKPNNILLSNYYDPIIHLSSFGNGTSVDNNDDLLTIVNQYPLMPCINESLDPIDIDPIDTFELDPIDELRFINLPYEQTIIPIEHSVPICPSLLLDPTILPQLDNIYNIELDRLEAITPTPINITFNGIPIHENLSNSVFSSDDIQDDEFDDDNNDETGDDDVFKDTDNDDNEDNESIIIDNVWDDNDEQTESNWKLGDGNGSLYPAISL